MDEFSLIRRYFQRTQPYRHASLGIGDDCALLAPLAGEQLAISTDMLVENRHFFADVHPAALGHKTLAVNLSDLAAMGAQPLGFTLAAAIPHINEAWLAPFSQGLFDLADAHACDLIGGDTTQGPLNLCVTVFGSVPSALALRRSTAQVGDDIYVSHANGGIGDARLALHLLLQQKQLPHHLPALPPQQRSTLLDATRHRLEWPQPRVALGLALRGIAHACADVSDGLSGDVPHILAASQVGATLFANNDQHQGLLHATSPALQSLGAEAALDFALAGGDDYELVFTAAPNQRPAIAQAATQAQVQVTRIGVVEAEPGLRWRNLQGQTQALSSRSFNHFAPS